MCSDHACAAAACHCYVASNTEPQPCCCTDSTVTDTAAMQCGVSRAAVQNMSSAVMFPSFEQRCTRQLEEQHYDTQDAAGLTTRYGAQMAVSSDAVQALLQQRM
eukprot:6172-Heterococcus_DN1.PRE.2